MQRSILLVLAFLIAELRGEELRPNFYIQQHPRGRRHPNGYWYKNCYELQKLHDEAYEEFKMYATLFEYRGLGSFEDFFKFTCHGYTTTSTTTTTKRTTTSTTTPRTTTTKRPTPCRTTTRRTTTPRTTTRTTTSTSTTTPNPNYTLEQLASEAYTEILVTKDRINAGYDSLSEVNDMVEKLTDQCSDIRSLMPYGISSVPNPSQVLIDTVPICDLILDTGIPNDNSDLDNYIEALSKI